MNRAYRTDDGHDGEGVDTTVDMDGIAGLDGMGGDRKSVV